MYKISIIVCIVLMVVFVGAIMWENNRGKQLDEQLEEAVANYLLVESKHKPTIIEMAKIEEDETLILSYKKAKELARKYSIGGYAYAVKDMPWPIRPSLFAQRFVEWLYLNDYEIVRKK